MTADFVIRHARSAWTVAGPAPRRGPSQRDISPIEDAAVAALAGRVVFVGPDAEWEQVGCLLPDAVTLDATSCSIIPGLVDPHTHAVYAGDRRAELHRRLAGATYAEIAAEGGGILGTVRETRLADEDRLLAESAVRLDEMLRAGTTTAEVKSGYGLETATELKMLRVIARLAASQPIELTATFLGAHEVAPEYRGRRGDYVDLVVGEMIPAVAQAGLAEWCDVFCEQGVFTPEESRRILASGYAAGLKPRIHADELAASGGSKIASRVGARSADHLLFVDAESAAAMSAAGVVATLLPIAAFYLKLGRFAPARMLIGAGVPVALATDLNPGGGFSASMPFAMALACFSMGMTLEEALVASTINAAWALDRHRTVGSLEVGKQMDAVVVAGDLVDLVLGGAPAIRSVIKRGRVVAGDGQAQ